MRQQIINLVLIFLVISCGFNQDKSQPITFYNNIAGWDISYIPIIEPYRSTSLDKGVTWSISRPEIINSFEVLSFGVSQNIIYGQTKYTWFLLDTKSKLYAEYRSEEELISTLQGFQVPVNEIANCNTYFDALANGRDLYWFPKDGMTYPVYPDIIPDTETIIQIEEKEQQQPEFSLKEALSSKKNKVYFFKLQYNKKGNDLYYLSFDNSPPILVKDSLVIPVFSDKNQIDITIYTPFPIAQEKGISEEKRFLKTKTAYIR